ncbi:hypothetical protein GCM10010260_83020 [Streptomyces filipinensis]|uniref:Uncharacterized protein n=1 Tax=Streptomyces filipinensis TaxID=66887 RepID=A0A918MGL3_9ACTN|nr:hypothetical protein GCM10010260_83020 [Streptomyces filipinensis]
MGIVGVQRHIDVDRGLRALGIVVGQRHQLPGCRLNTVSPVPAESLNDFFLEAHTSPHCTLHWRGATRPEYWCTPEAVPLVNDRMPSVANRSFPASWRGARVVDWWRKERSWRARESSDGRPTPVRPVRSRLTDVAHRAPPSGPGHPGDDRRRRQPTRAAKRQRRAAMLTSDKDDRVVRSTVERDMRPVRIQVARCAQLSMCSGKSDD